MRMFYYWSIAASEVAQEHELTLLQNITKMWITVRGFAYVSGWVEQYKQEQKVLLQKKKALRATLNSKTDTCDSD